MLTWIVTKATRDFIKHMKNGMIHLYGIYTESCHHCVTCREDFLVKFTPRTIYACSQVSLNQKYSRHVTRMLSMWMNGPCAREWRQFPLTIRTKWKKTLVNPLHWSSCTVEGALTHSLATSNLCCCTTGGSASLPKCNVALEPMMDPSSTI